MKYKLINNIFLGLLILGAFLVFFNFISYLALIGFVLGYWLFILIVSTNVRLNFFVDAFNSKQYTFDKRIALTFDDGPAENSLAILDVLNKFQVKASFFCIGKKIEEHPEIFKKIIEEGHMVGNHTYSHTRKMGFLSTSRIINEIETCDEIAERVGGQKLKTFRPPFGIINPKVQRALEFSEHQVIGWNLRSYDGILTSRKYILNRIVKKVKPGDVILLHDTRIETVEILEQLLLFLQANGYSPVRIDNLFNIDAYN